MKSGFLQVSENWKKSGNSSGQGKIFFGKVRENEKLVPPDVRFPVISPDPAGGAYSAPPDPLAALNIAS